MLHTSQRVIEAEEAFWKASQVWRTSDAKNKEDISASLQSDEFKAYEAAKATYERLVEIEQERDHIQREIYIRGVKDHNESSAYNKSLKEANAYIKAKHGEEI
jgi:uncharacterized Fe-S cluster-containing protein